MAKLIDLYIDQGSDFSATLPPVTKPDGTVLNLTGYTAKCQIRRSYATNFAVQLTTTIPTPANGVIVLSLPSSQTSGLSPFRYVYDVIIEEVATSFITKVFEGLVIVNPGVSSKPNTTLLTPYVPDDYGGL